MFWENLHHLDQQITLFINSFNSAPSDAVMQFFSIVKIWFPMYAIIAALMFWRLGWKKGLIALGAMILMVVCCDQFANLIKDSVARLRPLRDPYMIEHGLHVVESNGGGLYGFFSGHAANSFGFAVCSYMLIRQDRRLRWRGYAAWIFFWAAMVSVSRIFVGKHFFGDVVVGAAVGSAIGWVLASIAIRLMNRIGNSSDAASEKR